jgi:maltose O-acetyltransferase
MNRWINFLRARFRKWLAEERWLEDHIALGMKVGKNTTIHPGLIVDTSHCWLIEIGDRVTIAPHVYLLAHDASTKTITGFTKIGRITIADGAFVGARSTVCAGVTIGRNSIVGAGSVVVKSIPDNVVAAGNPARVICTLDEYRAKCEKLLDTSPRFSAEYTLAGGITERRKDEMKNLLRHQPGFVV